MSITKEYSIACVEVLEILKGLTPQEFNRIPKERIELYESQKDENYKFQLDSNKDFNEQISSLAQSIIANLFVRFIATPEDRQKIYEEEKAEYIKEELEKLKKIKLNPLFEETNKKETALVIKKKGILERLTERIKNFLNFGKRQ